MTDTLPTERQRFIDAAVALLDTYKARILAGDVSAIAVAHACADYSYGCTWEVNQDQPGVGAAMRSAATYLVHRSNVALDSIVEGRSNEARPAIHHCAEVVPLRPAEADDA